MPKKSGNVFALAGVILILTAMLLLFYNKYEDAQAGQEAEILLQEVQNIITTESVNPPTEQTEVSELDSEQIEVQTPEQIVVDIDGYDCIGCLSIPDLELELPVLYDWDYTKLKIAPCRQFGSSKTDNLVIVAHNYKNHFGSLSNLELGGTVVFTDMDGEINTYEVALMDTLNPDEVEAVQNSGYDLVLYTCTYGGKARVTVFCDRTVEEENSLRLQVKQRAVALMMEEP